MSARPAVLLLLAGLALGHGSSAPAQEAEQGISPAEKYFTNVELVNQDGETVRLYRDLLQGKVVAIDTIYTECVGICPVMSKTFQRLQEAAGERLGKDVLLLSFTIDPETDTPERLKEFADKFDAKPGWQFLTGPKENVKFALSKLGAWVEDRESHTAIIILGNEPTGLWKKAFGLAPADKVLPIFESVLDDQGPEGGAGP